MWKETVGVMFAPSHATSHGLCCCDFSNGLPSGRVKIRSSAARPARQLLEQRNPVVGQGDMPRLATRRLSDMQGATDVEIGARPRVAEGRI